MGLPTQKRMATFLTSMKTIFYALAFLVLGMISRASDEWESEHPLISGQYDVIGKRCESGILYSGTITIHEAKPNVFVVTRLIDGLKIIGSGKVDHVTPDKIPVFRMNFVENGEEFEGTLLWCGDLDNEGRISGYICTKGYQGMEPGLEALFATKKAGD
jgi:hypothetical protein